MRNNKGITLIVLIISVIILLILTSIATYTGMESYQNSRVIKFITQMQLIQAKVDEEYEKGEKNYGAALNADQQIKIANITNNVYTGNEENLKYFNSNALKDNFDLEGIDDEIVINFLTREVFSLTGVEYEGATYYTQYDLPAGQKLVISNNTIETIINFDIETRIDGLTAYIKVTGVKKGILKYKKENSETWKTLTNSIEENTEYKITESGKYQFKVNDTQKVESVNIVLTNSPKLETGMSKVMYNEATSQFEAINEWKYNYSKTSLNWAYASKIEDDVTTYYLWIPRFIYKTIDDVNQTKFVKGNSTVLTDNTTIDNSFTIPSYFENNPYSTGLWKEIISATDLSLIDLLQIT